MHDQQTKILIIGGGFGGIKCALDLEKKKLPNTRITLVSTKPHFDYHAALYRLVAGRSPLEVCIPLDEIFANTSVDVCIDYIDFIDPITHVARSSEGSTYRYDKLILAVGSETAYFNIPGIKEHSFGLKSIEDALRLKKHLHEVLQPCVSPDLHTVMDDNECAAHIVIIGGGASGVELAGELAAYTKKLAVMHGFDSSIIKIDLVERADRVLAQMPEDVSLKIQERLKNLGVALYLNKEVIKEDALELHLKDALLRTKTVVWTAGAQGNSLLSKTAGLEVNKRGQVMVDGRLHARGHMDIFVIGDAAETTFSGMAQTALYDASYVASTLEQEMRGKTPSVYEPAQPVYSIPVGPGWAAFCHNTTKYYGKFGWWFRRWLDLKVMMTLLTPYKAYKAWSQGGVVSESCPVCTSRK